jgi:hypothetical protein
VASPRSPARADFPSRDQPSRRDPGRRGPDPGVHCPRRAQDGPGNAASGDRPAQSMTGLRPSALACPHPTTGPPMPSPGCARQQTPALADNPRPPIAKPVSAARRGKPPPPRAVPRRRTSARRSMAAHRARRRSPGPRTTRQGKTRDRTSPAYPAPAIPPHPDVAFPAAPRPPTWLAHRSRGTAVRAADPCPRPHPAAHVPARRRSLPPAQPAVPARSSPPRRSCPMLPAPLRPPPTRLHPARPLTRAHNGITMQLRGGAAKGGRDVRQRTTRVAPR